MDATEALWRVMKCHSALLLRKQEQSGEKVEVTMSWQPDQRVLSCSNYVWMFHSSNVMTLMMEKY